MLRRCSAVFKVSYENRYVKIVVEGRRDVSVFSRFLFFSTTIVFMKTNPNEFWLLHASILSTKKHQHGIRKKKCVQFLQLALER